MSGEPGNRASAVGPTKVIGQSNCDQGIAQRVHRAHAHVAHGQPLEAVEAALLAQDGVEVGQNLGGMLAPAVAAVDDRHGSPFGGFVGCALLEVTHHDHVTVELQHLDGVFDRLLVPVAGAGHLGVGEAGDVAAQPVHGGLVGQAGAGRRLVEGRHHGLVLEHVDVATGAGDDFHLLRDAKDLEELVALEFLQRQNVTSSKTPHSETLLGLFGLRLD